MKCVRCSVALREHEALAVQVISLNRMALLKDLGPYCERCADIVRAEEDTGKKKVKHANGA